MKKILFLIIFLCSFLTARAQQSPYAFLKKKVPDQPLVLVYTNKPVNMQLFPRDAQDSGTVTTAGIVQTTGYDSVIVQLYKNGSLVKRNTQFLSYTGSNANFSITHRIKAELAEYKVIAYIKSDSTFLFEADSLVSGDVYVFAGQSNAQAPNDTMTYSDQFCRTFGVQTDSLNLSAYNPGDTLWSRSSAQYNGFASYPAGNYRRNVGVMALQLQKEIRDGMSIPTCVINASEQGTSIITHQRNNSSPMDLSRTHLYGKMLYRTTKAGVNSGVKAIVWYQGEIDVNSASSATYNNPKGISGYSTYANKFDSLYNSWKSDFTNLQKIYVIQIRPLNCAGNSDFAQELREIQRQLQNTYSDVQLVSSGGIGGYQLCHYDRDGYLQLAGQLFKNFALNFYPASSAATTDTVGNRPPTVKRAFYTDSTNTKIGIVFSNSAPSAIPSDTVIAGNTTSIKRYFYLNKSRTATTVNSVTLSNDTMFLNLAAASTASKLGYLPNRLNEFGGTYTGPWIRNSRGLALLSFDNVHIYESEAMRMFAVMPTITVPRGLTCDSLIKRLKRHGVWDSTDVFYMFANADTGLAAINWANPTAFNVIKPKGAANLSFSANKGYTGNNTRNGFLSTQWIPATHGSFVTLNNQSFSIFCRTNNQTDSSAWGGSDTSISYTGMILRSDVIFGPNHFYSNLSDANTNIFLTNNSSIGLFTTSRVSSSTVNYYKNGGFIGNKTDQTSRMLLRSPVTICGYIKKPDDEVLENFYDDPYYTVPFPGEISHFRGGGSFNTAQVTDYNSDIQWYLDEVGAEIIVPPLPLVYPTRQTPAIFADVDTGYIWCQYNAFEYPFGTDSLRMYYKTFANGGKTIDSARTWVATSLDGINFVNRRQVRTNYGSGFINYMPQGVTRVDASNLFAIQYPKPAGSDFYRYVILRSTDGGYRFTQSTDTIYTGSRAVTGNKHTGEDVTFLKDGTTYRMYFRDSTTQKIGGKIPLRTIAYSEVDPATGNGTARTVILSTRTNYYQPHSNDYLMSFNNFTVVKNGSDYWGLANMIRVNSTDRENELPTDADTVSIRLYYSSNGINFTPCNDTNSYISIPAGKKQIFGVPVIKGSELWIYTIETPRRHNSSDPTNDKFEIWLYKHAIAELNRFKP